MFCTTSPQQCGICREPTGIWAFVCIPANGEAMWVCRACKLYEELEILRNERCTVLAERDRLRAFAARIVEEYCWEYHDVDGGDIQDLAEQHGVIVPTPHDLETCTVESCPGCGYETDMLYRLTWTVTA